MGDPVTQSIIEKRTFVLHPLKSRICETTVFASPTWKGLVVQRKVFLILGKLFKGWAGIPVPVHSQEWKPLIPIPELWEWILSFPSRSRISGMFFFHSLPSPELWECFFFHSLPIPELWEWLFLTPFPFPNFGNVFFPFPSRSRIWGMELTIPVPECPKVIPARPWIINRAVPKAKTFVMDIAHCDSTVHSLYTNIYSHLCILGETRQDLDVGEEEREAQRGGHGGDI